MINEWNPTVIVSDIGIPGEDGYYLMRKIRALTHNIGCQIPAIALPGYASQGRRVESLCRWLLSAHDKTSRVTRVGCNYRQPLRQIRNSAIQDRDLDMRLDAP
jgi:CheY-like chemotaxis protein